MKKCNFEISDHGYGKNHIKLLQVQKHSSLYTIGEYEINVSLKLDNVDDYTEGRNQSVIATDSQKNTIYILAKKYGVTNPEEFAILVCNHFLTAYQQVTSVIVEIDKLPWQRLILPDEHNVQHAHNHAFICNEHNENEIRKVLVRQVRNDGPIVCGGMNGLRLLKTTQSGFVDFVNDEYCTLPNAPQRIFSTSVSTMWQFAKDTHQSIDFDGVYANIRNIILQHFAGDWKHGVYSPSVQHTLYQIDSAILNQLPQICKVYMKMPNKHYLDFDFSKFQQIIQHDNNGFSQDDNKNPGNAHYVYVPVDKPSGVIFAELTRKQSKL